MSHFRQYSSNTYFNAICTSRLRSTKWSFPFKFMGQKFYALLLPSVCCKLYVISNTCVKHVMCRMDFVHGIVFKNNTTFIFALRKKSESSHKRGYYQTMDNTRQLNISTNKPRTSHCQRQIVGEKKYRICASVGWVDLV